MRVTSGAVPARGHAGDPGEGGAVTSGQTGRRRADAVRNQAAILAATRGMLSINPDATMAQIAQAAGVGRVTLYGHFSSRAELIDAALADVLHRGNRVLEQLDLDGDPREALGRLVVSSWKLVDESRSLLAAAQRELPEGRIRDLHRDLEGRVQRLLERGQHEGLFRADLPVDWLLATMHALMHGAANEIAAGRLEPEDAGPMLRATLLAAYALPGDA